MQTATQTVEVEIPISALIESTIIDARQHRKEKPLDRQNIYEGYKRSLQRLLIDGAGLYDEYDQAIRNLATALNI